VYVSVPPLGRKKRSVASSDTSSGVSDSETNDDSSQHAWVLDSSHPKVLLDAWGFFLAVPGGGSWKEILSQYVKFERLVPQVSIFSV
jgi:hypothetical protein